jgi:hypothetical protein
MRVKQQGSKAAHITSAGTNQVKSGHGILRRIVFNTVVGASTVSVIDNTEGTTAEFVITNSAVTTPYDLEYGYMFHLGLRIITSGADDITVVYD